LSYGCIGVLPNKLENSGNLKGRIQLSSAINVTDVVTNSNERENQPGAPDGEIAPRQPQFSRLPKLFFSEWIHMDYFASEKIALQPVAQ